MPRNQDGSLRHLFRHLDDPVDSWPGNGASFTAFLRSPAETARRKKDLEMILSRPEFSDLAVRQLDVSLNTLLDQEKREPLKFAENGQAFVIERIVAVLELVLEEMAPRRWPELEALIVRFKSAASKTAPLRYSLLGRGSPQG